MILTLAWKELREHQGVWLTMAFMTVFLTWGLHFLVALDNPALAVQVAAFSIFGLSATYGVVCGAMMIAGEHEGGTLVFLDIFHGRRGALWLSKFTIGVVLVLTQAAVVALGLYLINEQPPAWVMTLVGSRDPRPSASVWIKILPVVILGAYSWGMLGSALTQRVLTAASIAALGVTPVWLIAILSPPPMFFALQAMIGVVVLGISYAIFLNQAQETLFGPAPQPELLTDAKNQFLRRFERFEHDVDEPDIVARPAILPEVMLEPPPESVNGDGAIPAAAAATNGDDRNPLTPSSPSAGEVLWWLTLQQAWPVLGTLAATSVLAGFLLGLNTQVIWPVATLLLGIACGTAAFAPEQRDLSYLFLSAQRLPLQTIWRFKIGFWLIVALIATAIVVFFHCLTLIVGRAAIGPREPLTHGSLPLLLGSALFYGVWLAYGFCTAQLVVWLCRKSILALLVSFLAALGSLGLWLPSMLSGGMNGWQLWATPLILLLATWFLMRAWASGRLRERRPVAALFGWCGVAALWVLLNFGYRIVEVPGVGAPLDPLEFRDSLPADKENPAATAIHRAIMLFDNGEPGWRESMAEAARLPVGILATPRKDDVAPAVGHLPKCRKIADSLLKEARTREPESAFDNLTQVLALARNLRNKASMESYLTGVQVEKDALDGIDQLLARGKPAPKLLRRLLAELNRHADETPPPVSCLQTECFRSGGLLANPNNWSFKAGGDEARIPEQVLAGGVAIALEMPWEAERKSRIWRQVWAGLFRAVETPHWELPDALEDVTAEKDATRKIFRAWLPAADGSGATRTQLAQLVDSSWLADTRLFPDVAALRESATRARWRVDGKRQAVALARYRFDHGKPAQSLQDLKPKFLPSLPNDPYSGQPYRYRLAPDGQGIVWSTGPDRIDHGGRTDGSHLRDGDALWPRVEFDLLTPEPRWR